jgi:hypothetical protein
MRASPSPQPSPSGRGSPLPPCLYNRKRRRFERLSTFSSAEEGERWGGRRGPCIGLRHKKAEMRPGRGAMRRRSRSVWNASYSGATGCREADEEAEKEKENKKSAGIRRTADASRVTRPNVSERLRFSATQSSAGPPKDREPFEGEVGEWTAMSRRVEGRAAPTQPTKRTKSFADASGAAHA